MKSGLKLALVAVAAVASAQSASAAEVIVNTVGTVPSSSEWGAFPFENTGTAAVTSTAARSGNGSLELTGDRTRAQIGVQYAFALTNLGPLSDVTGLTFDWRIAGDSISGYNPDYTPALRLLIQNGTVRQELIWEGVYNGTYGNTQRDTWYSSSITDLFYITGGSVNAGRTIADWANFLPDATVSGISVGAGSGALPTYHAFVDNVSLSTSNGSTTYNFEVAAVAAVPEPATWGMMILGFGAIGAAMRRRSKVRTTVSYA